MYTKGNLLSGSPLVFPDNAFVLVVPIFSNGNNKNLQPYPFNESLLLFVYSFISSASNSPSKG